MDCIEEAWGMGIIKSFHTNMRARVRVDGKLLEEIEVNNGLRPREKLLNLSSGLIWM